MNFLSLNDETDKNNKKIKNKKSEYTRIIVILVKKLKI